jgi:hypothetical protein
MLQRAKGFSLGRIPMLRRKTVSYTCWLKTCVIPQTTELSVGARGKLQHCFRCIVGGTISNGYGRHQYKSNALLNIRS